MRTADICDFLHLQILKSRQICSFHWTSKSWKCFSLKGALPIWAPNQGLCCLHIALLIPFHYLIPFMTFVR